MDPPQHLIDALGRPTVEWTAPARDAWRQAAGVIEGYRDRFRTHGQDLDQAPKDLGQRREWNKAHDTAVRARHTVASMFEKAADAGGKGLDRGRDRAQAVLERVVDLGMERKS